MSAFHSIFWKTVREFGFQKRTNTKYFLPREDVVAFFSIECPSGLYYVQFGIIPLYFPPFSTLYYTFGNRLKHADLSLRHHLNRNSSEDDITAWCEKVKDYLTNELMPLIDSISTASGMRKFLLGKQTFDGTGPVACAPNHLYELLVYTELFLHNLPNAEAAAALFSQSLQEYPYSPSAREELENQVIHTLEIAKDGQKITELFARWRTENLLLFQ